MKKRCFKNGQKQPAHLAQLRLLLARHLHQAAPRLALQDLALHRLELLGQRVLLRADLKPKSHKKNTEKT